MKRFIKVIGRTVPHNNFLRCLFICILFVARDGSSNNLDKVHNRMQNPKIRMKRFVGHIMETIKER
jgi:hypothetical protein